MLDGWCEEAGGGGECQEQGPRTEGQGRVGAGRGQGSKTAMLREKKVLCWAHPPKLDTCPSLGHIPPKADTQSKCVEANRPAQMSQTLRQPQHHVELPTGWSATGWRTSRHRGQPPRVSRVEGGWPADRAALLWKLRNSGHWNGVGIFGPGTDREGPPVCPDLGRLYPI